MTDIDLTEVKQHLDWQQKRRSALLTIGTAEKKIVMGNLTNKDGAHSLQLLLTQTASHKESGS